MINVVIQGNPGVDLSSAQDFAYYIQVEYEARRRGMNMITRQKLMRSSSEKCTLELDLRFIQKMILREE